ASGDHPRLAPVLRLPVVGVRLWCAHRVRGPRPARGARGRGWAGTDSPPTRTARTHLPPPLGRRGGGRPHRRPAARGLTIGGSGPGLPCLKPASLTSRSLPGRVSGAPCTTRVPEPLESTLPRKPAVFLSALVLASLGLTACGSNSDSPGDDATTPPAAHEETTTQEGRTTPAADAEDAVEEPTDTTEDTDDETADTAAETADPGPAPDGAVIPAAAVAKPPETIAQFTLMDGEGPAHIYSMDSPSAMVALDGN